jgi:hypothetical protein
MTYSNIIHTLVKGNETAFFNDTSPTDIVVSHFIGDKSTVKLLQKEIAREHWKYLVSKGFKRYRN